MSRPNRRALKRFGFLALPAALAVGIAFSQLGGIAWWEAGERECLLVEPQLHRQGSTFLAVGEGVCGIPADTVSMYVCIYQKSSRETPWRLASVCARTGKIPYNQTTESLTFENCVAGLQYRARVTIHGYWTQGPGSGKAGYAKEYSKSIRC